MCNDTNAYLLLNVKLIKIFPSVMTATLSACSQDCRMTSKSLFMYLQTHMGVFSYGHIVGFTDFHF